MSSLSECPKCGRVIRGICKPCRRKALAVNILKAQATRTKYMRLGFGKYDGRKNKTGKFARKQPIEARQVS